MTNAPWRCTRPAPSAIGRAYEDETVLVFAIRDGKIAEQWSYVADQYGTEEFLS